MVLSIISFTENGICLSAKIANKLSNAECKLYTKWSAYLQKKQDNFIQFYEKSISEWAKEQFDQRYALLFIGACGIAVRAIAPCITDKLHDSPVLVIDEKGQYVIPILSGHMGGANELALMIAGKIQAAPIITTATDINNKFAVDLFARENGLSIVNKEGIAKVSSKVLSGNTLTISVETGHLAPNVQLPHAIQLVPYPPNQPVDIVISSEKVEFDAIIRLIPKEYIIGMGCKKGKNAEEITAFIKETLVVLNISGVQIAALASIDVKSKEPGLLAWSSEEKIPFLTYSVEELANITGDFHTSDFVKNTVGVDNVCERAALKAAGTKGRIIYGKHARDGMTIAVARKEWKILFT